MGPANFGRVRSVKFGIETVRNVSRLIDFGYMENSASSIRDIELPKVEHHWMKTRSGDDVEADLLAAMQRWTGNMDVVLHFV